MAMLIALAVPSAIGSARADEGDALNFELSQTLSYDNNLYRLPDGFAAPGGDRHDVVSVTRAGLLFDRSYSRQRLRADLSMSRSRYAVHGDLDYDSPDARLNWGWQLGNRLSGTVGYEYRETLAGFDDYGDTRRNINTYSRAFASADYWLHPDWAVGLGYGKSNSRFDRDTQINSEFESRSLDFNLTYRPASGNRVVLTLRDTDGLYPGRNRNPGSIREYRQQEARLNMHWQLTGISKISGYIGQTRRSYEFAPNRDFSGTTGRLAFDWAPTVKTAISLSVRREIGAEEDLLANYALTDVVSLASTWQLTSKVTLGANWERRQRDYGGDPQLVIVIGSVPDRNDVTQRYGLNLNYQPERALTLALSYVHQNRDASTALREYESDAIYLSGSFRF